MHTKLHSELSHQYVHKIITERLEGTLRDQVQPPPAKAGFLQQVALVVIKTGLEYLHRQRLHNFSEQSKSATVRDFIATSLGFPISLGNFEVLIVGILKIMLMQISLVLLLI